jgi:hypothetical protein
MLVVVRRLDLRMHEGYCGLLSSAQDDDIRACLLTKRQLSICRYMFMISEESASRCHMCTSYEDSTAVNYDQRHCVHTVVCMPTCLKAKR